MAAPSRAITAMARPGFNLAANGRIASRAFSTAPRAASSTLRYTARPAVASRLAVSSRAAFRRAYSDEAPAPKPKPGKLRRAFRWIWRLTYLSVGGLVGYTIYTIYQDRNPEEQFEADPSKKTLVILGTSHMLAARGSANRNPRTWFAERH